MREETEQMLKIDDGFLGHRKAEGIPDRLLGFWLRGLLYAARNLTDGVLPRGFVRTKTQMALCDDLLRRGLWEKTPTGYLIHDYLEWNESRRECEERKEANRRRQTLYRNNWVVQAVKERDGDICRYCGVTVSWTDRRGSTGATIEHVDPDGPHHPENVVVSCKACNVRKGHRTPEQAGMKLSVFPFPNNYYVTVTPERNGTDGHGLEGQGVVDPAEARRREIERALG